ncbi:hypothetical protein K466DRAFT_212844 [Polyporus arcularius HHB13444]|uniref:Uncharacterized protein n=1 Tax=Polyporus arcularius HHB13444 TaxID=1314778 RepID=A0A5C3P7B5_9APHY|nr:hypothetical protein K466DRAFT_212844 [Polyporus arcularius HHB13444]
MRCLFSVPIHPRRKTLQSVGDLIVWSRFWTGSADVSAGVINWKTNAVVWQYGPSVWGQFLIMDPSHVLIFNDRGVFVYEFDPDAPRAIPAPPATDEDYVLHLALPRLKENSEVVSSRSYEQGPRYLTSDRPFFRENPDLDVLALYIEIFTQRNYGREHFVLVVPFKTIRARLEALAHVQPEERQISRSVPWDQWGSDGARLLKLGASPHGISVMGSRVAIPFRDYASLNTMDIYIVDVRPKSEQESFVGCDRDVSSALGAPHGVIDASDTIQGLESFAEPVTTTLPYRMTYLKARSDGESKFAETQGLTHDGMVIACSPLGSTT